MFYKIEFVHSYDDIFKEFTDDISEYCRKSQFHFLSQKPQEWTIPSKKDFEFFDCFLISDSVPVFSMRVWDMITDLTDRDGLYSVPLTLTYCGESHRYFIAVPAMIDCFDEEGRIDAESVGRYKLFKIIGDAGYNIYMCSDIAVFFRSIDSLNFKGVD